MDINTNPNGTDPNVFAIASHLPISAIAKVDGKNRSVYCGDAQVYYPLLSSVITLPDGVTETQQVVRKTDNGNDVLKVVYNNERIQALWDALATAIDAKVRGAATGDPATKTVTVSRDPARSWEDYLAKHSGGGGEYMKVRAAFLTALKSLFGQLVQAGRASQASADTLVKLLGNEAALRTSDNQTKQTAKQVLDTLLANLASDEDRDYLATYTDKLYAAIEYDAHADLMSIDLSF